MLFDVDPVDKIELTGIDFTPPYGTCPIVTVGKSPKCELHVFTAMPARVGKTFKLKLQERICI